MRKNKNYYITTAEDTPNNLFSIREAKDLTQQTMADELNIDRSTHTYYESGKHLPDIFNLSKLAKF